jgi:hypothetical protein
MAKQNPYTDKLLAIFGKREIDESASTIQELSEVAGYAKSHMQKLVKEKLKAGEIEMVWKHQSGRLCAAYRPKRGK